MILGDHLYGCKFHKFHSPNPTTRSSKPVPPKPVTAPHPPPPAAQVLIIQVSAHGLQGVAQGTCGADRDRSPPPWGAEPPAEPPGWGRGGMWREAVEGGGVGEQMSVGKKHKNVRCFGFPSGVPIHRLLMPRSGQ